MSEQAAKDKIQHTVTGKVVSSKTAKTIAVEVSRMLKHPQYGKYIRRTTRLLAHDEAGAAHEGDTVIDHAVPPDVGAQVVAPGRSCRAQQRNLI